MRRGSVLLFLVGCASTSSPAAGPSGPRAPAAPCTDVFGDEASFALDRAALQARSPALVAKLDGSAYRYFRMLGPEMAARACSGVRDLRWHLPLAAIHGDAHVGQFVVTDETYGLEDFDQSGFGPAVVDLVRYAASVHLACHEVSWPCRPEPIVGVWLDRYRAALDRASAPGPAPGVVARLRRGAPADRDAWLAWADSRMQSLPAAAAAMVRARWEPVARQLAELHPLRPADFAGIVRMGALEMGVGSLLERKILLRARGDSDAPGDDLVLEARSAPVAVGRPCSWRPPHGGSLHSLMMMSILGRRMPEVSGFGTLSDDPGAPEFWVQSWDPGYRELSLEDLQGQTELEELAADAAQQLAGHFWTRFPEALRPQQRLAQLHAFDLVAERAPVLARTLAAEVLREWQRFRGAGRGRSQSTAR